MADLFERDKSTISRHLKNIFDEGELDEESVVAVFATTAADGKTYQVTYYDLDEDEAFSRLEQGNTKHSVDGKAGRNAGTTIRRYAPPR